MNFRSSNSDDDLSYADDDVLHKLALNEVFVGESHAARVSYYDVQLDDGPLIKQKSSGMTICTGTGSTSWFHINLHFLIIKKENFRHYNINRLIEQTVYDIFETTKKQLKRNELTKNIGFELDRVLDSQFIEQICRLQNADLIFSPDEKSIFAFARTLSIILFNVLF